MRQMIWSVSAFSLVLLISPWVKLHSTQLGQGADKQTEIAERRVPAFDVEGSSFLDALLHLGRQERIPMGIEYLDPRDLEKEISVHLSATSVAGVVKGILDQTSGYTWRIENGVVVISHPATASRERNLLDVVLREFSIPEKTALSTAATVMLPAQLKRQLHPPRPTSGVAGIAGSVLGGRIENQVGPLKLRNVTVRQVLNRLVSEGNNAAWVIRVHPMYLGQLQEKGLWYVIEYDAPQEQWSEFIGKLLRDYWPPECGTNPR